MSERGLLHAVIDALPDDALDEVSPGEQRELNPWGRSEKEHHHLGSGTCRLGGMYGENEGQPTRVRVPHGAQPSSFSHQAMARFRVSSSSVRSSSVRCAGASTIATSE